MMPSDKCEFTVNDKYTKPHLSVFILFTVHHEVFPAGTLEAQVRRTSAFKGTSWENRVMYGGLYQNTRVVLYLLYTQPEISYYYCIIA